MSTAADRKALWAERAANRAAEASQDAVTLLAQGRITEALDYLNEAQRHITTAEGQLKDGARDG